MPWKVLFATLLGLMALTSVQSVHADPEVTGVEVIGADRVTVGDRFHYVLTLEAANGTQIGIAPGSLPPEFELISAPKTSSRAVGNGRSRLSFDLELAAFLPGALTIPPLEIQFEEPDGTTGTVLTPPARILIASVLPPDGGQIAVRDLKPQLEIGSAGSIGIFLAAIAAVLIALSLVVALILRSMRPKPVLVVAVVDTTGMGPEDRARAILEEAGAAFAIDRDFVEYYGKIAVTIRNYLTERYGFHAFALTTLELRTEMNRRGIDRWQTRLVDGLLTQCDGAVYARYVPALERADHDLTAAFEIVEMSRPLPEPLAVPAEEAAVR